MVLREGKVLLVKRAKRAGFGLWSLPGGHIEPGETARDAALRELLEETGVTAEIEHIAECVDIIRHDDAGNLAFHYVVSCFSCRWTSGEPKAGSDVSEACWIGVDALQELAMTPGTQELIVRIMARRGTVTQN